MSDESTNECLNELVIEQMRSKINQQRISIYQPSIKPKTK